MTTLEKLRAAYADDLIDLETFEEFVEAVLKGCSVALPFAVELRYGAVSGPQSAHTMLSVLKTAWS